MNNNVLTNKENSGIISINREICKKFFPINRLLALTFDIIPLFIKYGTIIPYLD